MEPKQTYHRRKAAYDRLQAKQQQAANRLSNYRLFAVLVGLALSIYLYRTIRPAAGLGMGLVTLLLFGYLAFRHDRLRRRLAFAHALRDINQKGADRTEGRWTAFADTGAEFKDDDHAYASDLDLFGPASLFQWISSAQTPFGRAKLAQVLCQTPGERGEIRARQEAVAELAPKLAWRQRFEAEGLLVSNRTDSADSLLTWAGQSQPAYLQPFVKLGILVLPAITLLTVGLYFYHTMVPWPVPALFVLVQIILLRLWGKERAHALSTVYRHEARLRTYARMLERFENQRFDAPWLKARQARLRDAAGRSAFQQIRRLSTIAERISNRENAYFLIVNILILWDYQCMVALEEWKRESGKRLGIWLEVLAEIEALCSLSNIRFEHPGWATPALVEPDGQTGLSARQLGHPLIPGGRVCNNFDLNAPGRITVVTGSNMSGKSTFLRTVGVNLVLAYAGAPVCAEQFSCSLMHLWTSMRTADNLGQSISSFYAEVLRTKRIVDAARTARPVCFLIDEIFKGTNSHDRHLGAKALIVQLEKEGAFGLISTHDLELGDLERESGGRITNYHFREYYQDGELRFDYILRHGISTTRNALYLIRMMGIEVEEK
ncbi:MAG TPA: DNA mismatch repair protein [Symbiobacteriaceae bacterium]|nr:DNA mismatch repair protein [Symbiobacteriaceae bacterium]